MPRLINNCWCCWQIKFYGRFCCPLIMCRSISATSVLLPAITDECLFLIRNNKCIVEDLVIIRQVYQFCCTDGNTKRPREVDQVHKWCDYISDLALCGASGAIKGCWKPWGISRFPRAAVTVTKREKREWKWMKERCFNAKDCTKRLAVVLPTALALLLPQDILMSSFS